jgi:hypothetical protein
MEKTLVKRVKEILKKYEDANLSSEAARAQIAKEFVDLLFEVF